MENIIKDMNGTLWIFAILLIGMVVVQSLLFLRLALNFNKKNKVMTKEEVSQAAKTGFISVLGPAVSVVVICISLITLVGPAVTFMRCGVIGSPDFELMMAEYTAAAVGVEFGSPEFTKNIFVLCIFGMTLASAPYFITTIVSLKPLDKAVIKTAQAAGKKESFIPMMGSAALMGILIYLICGYYSNPGKVVSFISAFIASYFIGKISKKHKWVAQWNMAFSMIIGMTVAQCFVLAIA